MIVQSFEEPVDFGEMFDLLRTNHEGPQYEHSCNDL